MGRAVLHGFKVEVLKQICGVHRDPSFLVQQTLTPRDRLICALEQHGASESMRETKQ